MLKSRLATDVHYA